MKIFLKIVVCVASTFFFGTTHTFSQVFLGDANNDGIVNNVDILYIGYAFGSLGPARVEERNDGPATAIALAWEQNFPDSLNYIYADTDGNGLIEGEDFATVFQNYGNRSEDYVPKNDESSGVDGFDPQLSFGIPELIFPITAGSQINIPINLGSTDLPISSFNGIAFTIEYDPTAISDIKLDFSDSWIAAPNESFTFQKIPEQQTNNLDVASTRLGPDVLAGQGQIGSLSVVVEQDLIDFLKGRLDSAMTIIKFKKLTMVDNDFNKVPITGDSIEFKIYDPQLVSTIHNAWHHSIDVFPTPATDEVNLKSPIEFYQLELISAAGVQLMSRSFPHGRKQLRLPCSHLTPATYLLRLRTERGLVVKRLMVGH